MAVRFVVVPQWQGSGSSRAMRLVDGAGAIAGDLPSSGTVRVDVPLEAGDAEGTGIHRFSSLRVTRQRFAQAVERVEEPLVVIGGDCSVEHPALVRAAERGPLAVLWFDAHPDANSIEGSPSHAFGGMALRALADEGVVEPARVALLGARCWDPDEEEWAERHGVTSIGVDELADPARLLAWLPADAAAVYVHVDLDVLDPPEFAGVLDPQPFGLAPAALVAAIRAVRERLPLAGAGITGFSPASEAEAADDLPTILRVVGAITSGV